MRRLIFRPLVLLATFLLGLFVTALLTFASDALANLLDEPSETIPTFCQSGGPGPRLPICSEAAYEAEEYAVYSAVLAQGTMADTEDRLAPLVVEDQSEVLYEESYLSQSLDELNRNHPSLEPEARESFRATNASLSQPRLKNLFNVPFKTFLITRQEVAGYFEHLGPRWQAFERRYPGARGLVTLSRVGFNHDMSQAIVYTAFTCGDLCGQGALLFLVKEGREWKIRGSAGVWIS